MDRKPVSDAELAALGTFQGEIDRNSNFRQQAIDHNLGRNLRVAKLLGYLALLRQRGVAIVGKVECVAAIRQNFSSSQTMTHMGLPTGPHQAAHYLPGQIRIGGKEIWKFAPSLAMRGQIEFLFAEVEHLPLQFNQADTAAEAKGQSGGLCAALAHACTTLLLSKVVNSAASKMPLDVLATAYGDWHRDALAALRSAVARKSAMPGVPSLEGNPFEGYTQESVAARSMPNASEWNRDESLRVLQYYLEDQPRRTWQSLTANGRVLQEVESNSKG